MRHMSSPLQPQASLPPPWGFAAGAVACALGGFGAVDLTVQPPPFFPLLPFPVCAEATVADACVASGETADAAGGSTAGGGADGGGAGAAATAEVAAAAAP